MIHEVRCTCKHNQLLFKVIDGNIQVMCRSKECRSDGNTKKLISIKKLFDLDMKNKLSELEVENKEASEPLKETE